MLDSLKLRLDAACGVVPGSSWLLLALCQWWAGGWQLVGWLLMVALGCWLKAAGWWLVGWWLPAGECVPGGCRVEGGWGWLLARVRLVEVGWSLPAGSV